jgi:hypothetical protein
MNNLRGAFRILQVVQGTTSTVVTNSTNTYANTGLSATITPRETASRILMLINHAACYKAAGNAFSGLNLRILRGASVIQTYAIGLGYTAVSSEMTFNANFTYIDSPSTTGAVTYSTQFANNANAASVQVQASSSLSTLTLLEVSS